MFFRFSGVADMELCTEAKQLDQTVTGNCIGRIPYAAPNAGKHE
jgi:hypothetical protein